MSGATNNKDGSKKRWIHGRAVQDGKVRFLSVSSLEKGDSSKPTGCLRRWHYQYIGGIKEAQSDAMEKGERIHAEIAHYLTTGEKLLSGQVLAGLHMIPEPGPDLLVEHDIVPELPNGKSGIEIASLRAAGVPLVGAIDLIHSRGINKGTEDIEHIYDPPGTIEVVDWKCLAQGSEIFDVASARRRDVSESGPLEVTALDTRENWRVVTTAATSFPSGQKTCVEVSLRDGSRLTSSEDHPILTQRGWVHAAKLELTDLVAVSSTAPEPKIPTLVTDNEVKFIAYMMSDGGCSGPSMRFTNMTVPVISDWQQTVTELGYTFKENKCKGKARDFSLHQSNKNPLREKWQLFGLSKEKRMPASLWGLPRKQVALFLNRFWACDGYISDHNINIELASEKLIDDLRFLLLRLGIRGRKYHRDSREKFKSWVLMVSSMDVPKFLNVVGYILGKETECEAIKLRLSNRQSRDATAYPVDRVAVERICDELGFEGRTQKGSRRSEVWKRLCRNNGFVSRTAFLKLCQEFNYKGEYTKYLVDGLEWERVRSVSKVGILPVYDLNVPEIHSFSANGIFVHNTCRTMNNAKKGSELLKTIQMAGYGKYIFETEPEAKLVRLSHGYFPQQGVPRKTTILADRDQIEKAWEHSNRVASSIVDAAKETNPDLVEANTEACMSYGRECPAARVCSARSNNVMSKFVANIIPVDNLTKATSSNMSILANLKSKPSTLPEPRPTRSIFEQVEQKAKEEPGPLAASSSPGEATDEVSRLRKELARLEAQERLAKGPELLPPDVPESNPILASLPKTDNSFTQSLALAAETKEVIAEMIDDAPAAPKKRGRKPKVKEPVHVVPDPNPEDVPPVPSPQEDIDPIAIPVNFYVDSTPDGVDCESFWPLVDHLVEVMCKEASVPDIRLSTDDRFAFGRWKGVLADMIYSTPLEGGNYQLLHAQGDIAMVVVETMRQIVRKTSGLFVMGAR